MGDGRRDGIRTRGRRRRRRFGRAAAERLGERRPRPGDPDGSINDVAVGRAGHAYMSVDDQLATSANGGQTWTPTAIPAHSVAAGAGRPRLRPRPRRQHDFPRAALRQRRRRCDLGDEDDAADLRAAGRRLAGARRSGRARADLRDRGWRWRYDCIVAASGDSGVTWRTPVVDPRICRLVVGPGAGNAALTLDDELRTTANGGAAVVDGRGAGAVGGRPPRGIADRPVLHGLGRSRCSGAPTTAAPGMRSAPPRASSTGSTRPTRRRCSSAPRPGSWPARSAAPTPPCASAAGRTPPPGAPRSPSVTTTCGGGRPPAARSPWCPTRSCTRPRHRPSAAPVAGSTAWAPARRCTSAPMAVPPGRCTRCPPDFRRWGSCPCRDRWGRCTWRASAASSAPATPGATWTPVTGSLPLTGREVRQVAASGSRIYAVLGSGFATWVYTTADAGAHWTLIRKSANFEAVAVDPLHSATVFVQAIGGLARSTDAGAHFTAPRKGPDAPVFDAVRPGWLYALGNGRSWRSTDGGLTWRAFAKFHGMTLTGADPRSEVRRRCLRRRAVRRQGRRRPQHRRGGVVLADGRGQRARRPVVAGRDPGRRGRGRAGALLRRLRRDPVGLPLGDRRHHAARLLAAAVPAAGRGHHAGRDGRSSRRRGTATTWTPASRPTRCSGRPGPARRCRCRWTRR